MEIKDTNEGARAMGDKLTVKIFDFFITTKCTMNCKLCCIGVPYVQHPVHVSVDVAAKEMKEFFGIWDYAERIEFIGGEPLMNPNIYEIVKESLKYRDQFGKIRITTNSTIVPGDNLLGLLCDSGIDCDFIVDDYGDLSVNLAKIESKLTNYGIAYRKDIYVGETQNYGGWVSYGDYVDKGYTEEEVRAVFEKCICPNYPFTVVFDGKVFQCARAMAMYIVKRIMPKTGEYVDFFDETMSREQKREIAFQFNRQPTSACRYCLAFDSKNGKRYPAAEQVERER